ncbi:MAG: MmcQ/YjbR family DNA-binding protein [Micropepsaceae bacterium]
MPVTTIKARKIALALPDASEAPHFDRAAFRTPRRIFATMPADGASMNLMFDLDQQEFWCENEPSAFAPVPGGWGKMGCTTCQLRNVDEATFKSALIAAHARAMAPAKKKRRTKV